MKYKTPDELLDFILTKCGNMEYEYSEYHVDNKDPNSLFFRELNIIKGFDIKRIYFAHVLMLEEFGYTFDTLVIRGLGISVIEEGYLENMELKRLFASNNNLTKLPKLPEGLIYLGCINNDIDRINELPKSLEYKDVHTDRKTKIYWKR